MAKLRKFPNSPYWYAEGRDANNRRWSVSTKQTDKSAAARVGRRLDVERALPRARPLTLASALVALHAHKMRKKVSDSEVSITRTKGARLIEHFGPSFDCNELTRDRINQYVDARRAAAIADSTISKELGKLWEALRHAGEAFTGKIDSLKTDVLESAAPRERWLDDPEYVALLEHVFHTRRDYVIVHCSVGVRYGELYRIEARHMDRAQRRVFVIGTKGDARYRQRWVPLGQDAFEVLCARAKLHPTGSLFPERWRVSNMKRSLAQWCAKAGIAPVTANDLRRTFASWCCRRGVSELECQKFMGHSPASQLVRKVYAQLAPEAGRAAVATFPRAPKPPETPAKEVSQQVSQAGRRFGGLGGGSRDAVSRVFPGKPGDPSGIRIRVTGVRGRCPEFPIYKTRGF